jgi:hypothetical protein
MIYKNAQYKIKKLTYSFLPRNSPIISSKTSTDGVNSGINHLKKKKKLNIYSISVYYLCVSVVRVRHYINN